MRRTAWAAAFAAAMCMASGAASAAPFCKTLKGAGVTVGEENSRKDADGRLDQEIAAWAERYKVPAIAKNRKMECKVYIELLNEFECNAEATVCRDLPGGAAAQPVKKAPAKIPAATKNETKKSS